MVTVEESDFLPVACTLVCINQHCDFPERKKYNGVDPIPIKGLPHLGTLPLKDILRRYDSCKFPIKNYLIYFWVDEETKKVQIIGAVYGRKDQRHQLSNLDMF